MNPCQLNACVETYLLRSAIKRWLQARHPDANLNPDRPDLVPDRVILAWLDELASPTESAAGLPSIDEMEAAIRHTTKWDTRGHSHEARVIQFLAAFDRTVYENGWNKWFEGEKGERLAVKTLTKLLAPAEFRRRVESQVQRDNVRTVSALQEVLLGLRGLMEGLLAGQKSGPAAGSQNGGPRSGGSKFNDGPSGRQNRGDSSSRRRPSPGGGRGRSRGRGGGGGAGTGPAPTHARTPTFGYSRGAGGGGSGAGGQGKAHGSQGGLRDARDVAAKHVRSRGPGATQRPPAPRSGGPPGGCFICRGEHFAADCPRRKAMEGAGGRRSDVRMAWSALHRPAKHDGRFDFRVTGDGHEHGFVVDTGSDRSYVSEAWLRGLELAASRAEYHVAPRPLTHRFGVALASGTTRVEITAAIRVSCWVRLPTMAEPHPVSDLEFYVMPDADFDFLIGRDIISNAKHRPWIKHAVNGVVQKPKATTTPALFMPGATVTTADAKKAAAERAAARLARVVANKDAAPTAEKDAAGKRRRKRSRPNRKMRESARRVKELAAKLRVPSPERPADEDASDDPLPISASALDDVDRNAFSSAFFAWESGTDSDEERAREMADELVLPEGWSDAEWPEGDLSLAHGDETGVTPVEVPPAEILNADADGPAYPSTPDREAWDAALRVHALSMPHVTNCRAAYDDGVDHESLAGEDTDSDAETVVSKRRRMHDSDRLRVKSGEDVDVGSDDEEEICKAISTMLRGAEEQGATASELDRLRTVLRAHENVWRLKLRGDAPAEVTPLEVRVRADARPVRARPRRYTPEQREFMKQFVDQLLKYGLVYRNSNARWASAVHPVARPHAKVDDPLLKRYRFTVDLRPVNAVTIPLMWPMPHLEGMLASLRGARVFATLDLFNGYWQAPLAEESQEYHSIVTDRGVYTPTRVIQGCADGTQAFQAMMEEVLSDLIGTVCLVWLDDVLVYGADTNELFDNLDRVLTRIEDANFKCSATKCTLLQHEAKWCGKIISARGVSHDPERVAALAALPPPVTAADALQFLASVNWMRSSIPEYARMAAPLYQIVEAAQKRSREDAVAKGGRPSRARSKAALKRYELIDFGWSAEHEDAFEQVKDALRNVVPLAYPDERKEMCLFTDASKDGWAAVLTQVDAAAIAGIAEGKASEVAWLDHEPLAFLGSQFKGSEKNWAIVEKEAYAIVEACRRLDYMVKRPEGFRIYTDHRNLRFIFDPTGRSDLGTTSTEKIARWAHLLMGFRYKITHIPGEDNVWADLLTRWGRARGPELEPEAAVARCFLFGDVYLSDIDAGSDAESETDVSGDDSDHERAGGGGPRGEREARDERDAPSPVAAETRPASPGGHLPPERVRDYVRAITGPPYAAEEDGFQPALVLELKDSEMPTRDEIRAAQDMFLRRGGAPDVHLGRAVDDGLWLDKKGKVWIPDECNLRLRICIVAHQGPAGHRGMTTTKREIMRRFVWNRVTRDVEEFIRQCLHCRVNAGGARVPRPWAEAVHATRPNQVLHFDYMLVDKKETRERLDGLRERAEPEAPGMGEELDDRAEYLLVLKDDFTNFVWLAPKKRATALGAAKTIAKWCSLFGVPEVFVSDQGSHFVNNAMKSVTEALELRHHLTVAYAPWANGTVERVNSEVLRVMRALSSEWRVKIEDWPVLVPIVNAALNSSESGRLGGYTPQEAFTGRRSEHPLDAILKLQGEKRELRAERVDAAKVKNATRGLSEALEDIHRSIADHEAARGRRGRGSKWDRRAVQDVKFGVGDYVLVARLDSARRNKLQGVWKGPMRVVNTINDHVFEVEHLVTGAKFTAHAERLRFYSDKSLDVTTPLKDLVAYQDGEYLVESVLDVRRKKGRQDPDEPYEVLVKWQGFEEDATDWQPMREIMSNAPDAVLKAIKGVKNRRLRADLLEYHTAWSVRGEASA